MGLSGGIDHNNSYQRCEGFYMVEKIKNSSHTYHEKKIFGKKRLDSNGEIIVYYTMLKRAQVMM